MTEIVVCSLTIFFLNPKLNMNIWASVRFGQLLQTLRLQASTLTLMIVIVRMVASQK